MWKGHTINEILKLSHDKTMYDFESMLFYSLNTVFTEIF